MPGRNWAWLDVDDVHGKCLLPCHLFRSKTLVKLSLGTNTNIGKLPPDVSLPALKSLSIDSIVFAYKDLCDVLLPGCPMLEELTVRHENDLNELYTYSISSQSIKKLKVYYDSKYRNDYMSFDAPSLVSLDYTDYALYKYPLVNFESLLEAKLNLYYSEKIKRPDITGLIIGISNVQTLHLCGGSVDGNDGDTCDVTIGLLQVKVLDVLGYKGTAKEFEHLKSLFGGIECIEKMRVEFEEYMWW
ncbi:unnamed protein product [Brassica rapa]|uniref:F-box/LRR-repeat protein 15/At3g58940/PEG3-like LRR domain-containing protein n=1 Tax=Brassica campestris TaxID=3711 RepID=A0A8D9D0N2_BRACM|nr:unnamed protein product [Brassica rapa]